MAPSPQPQGVQPASGALNCGMHDWVPRVGQDLYTDRLTECNVLATWTAEAHLPNTIMHVVGDPDYQPCINKLIQQIRENSPAITYVIAVSGPDNAIQVWFENSWYAPIRTAVMASNALTPQQKQRIIWGPAQFNLLRAAPASIKNCFALLQDGKHGPSHHPPAPSTSSSSSSGSFGNKGPLAGGRPGSSGSKTGSPAGSRPSSSSGKAPTGTAAGKKVAVAPPAKKAVGKR